MIAALATGALLKMLVAHLPFEHQLLLVATPEAARQVMVLQAALCAGVSMRVFTAAAQQAVVGGIAFSAGAALSWQHFEMHRARAL